MGESVAFPYLACLILRTASGGDIVAVKFPGACPGFPDFKTSLTKFFLDELVQAAAELPGKVRHKEQERGL